MHVGAEGESGLINICWTAQFQNSLFCRQGSQQHWLCYYLWRNTALLLFLKKCGFIIIFEEMRFFYYLWSNAVLLLSLKKCAFVIIFEEMRFCYYLWRNAILLLSLKKRGFVIIFSKFPPWRPANIGPWKDSYVIFFAHTHDISITMNTAKKLQVTHKTYNLKGTRRT